MNLKIDKNSSRYWIDIPSQKQFVFANVMIDKKSHLLEESYYFLVYEFESSVIDGSSPYLSNASCFYHHIFVNSKHNFQFRAKTGILGGELVYFIYLYLPSTAVSSI